MEFNKIYNMDCLNGMKHIKDNSINLCVTSPPYYNAREYSKWEKLEHYLINMRDICSEIYRVLKNHSVFVLNVGDIVGQIAKAKWSTKKIPLGAYFIVMCEEIGFQFVDDYIWDKGEPQSKRHLGNPPYPHYQYPVNSYEHIIIFIKHDLDKTKISCPVCNQTIIASNSQTAIGVQSWECKNPECSQKSQAGRGKRFSKRSVMMNDYKREENLIDSQTIKLWRKDIVRLNPVIKINSKGENKLGHTAPFPKEIPEMAIKFFTGVNDIVLEPFAGSGTTIFQCLDLKRRYIAFEIDSDYYNLTQNKIINYYKN